MLSFKHILRSYKKVSSFSTVSLLSLFFLLILHSTFSCGCILPSPWPSSQPGKLREKWNKPCPDTPVCRERATRNRQRTLGKILGSCYTNIQLQPWPEIFAVLFSFLPWQYLQPSSIPAEVSGNVSIDLMWPSQTLFVPQPKHLSCFLFLL